MKQPIPFGNYYLMDLIAKGGMAEVFKAKYLGSEGFSKVVAVKRILPELAEEQDFIQMFIDEAKIASQLSHANITQILQLGEAQGSYFIAMEFVQGKDFRTIYERSRRDNGFPVSPQMAAFVLSSICDGIDYAHRRCNQAGKHLGIIHRDVSPQNLIASFDGDIKLIDFGIAKAQDKLVKTEAGILKGKYCYMSPEQVRGHDIDHRSDIFGLGVVLHEILTRQRLFLGTNDLKTLENVIKKEIPPPSFINPEIPQALDNIVMRALSRNLSRRYQYASEMREDLMRFLYSFPSVFGRRELSAYMHHVFANDLEKEMRRTMAYEPFFEALPNTPLPSAVEQISQSIQVPPNFEPPGMSLSAGQISPESSQTGALPTGQDQVNVQQNDVTSYSGPHPYPNGFQQPAAAPAFHGGAVFTQNFYQQPGQNPQGAFQTPPAVAPPSFMYGSGEDDDDDDDDATAIHPTYVEGSPSPPPNLQSFGQADEDLPTKQLTWSEQAQSEPDLPQTALLSSAQLLGGVSPQSYDYLQAPQPNASQMMPAQSMPPMGHQPNASQMMPAQSMPPMGHQPNASQMMPAQSMPPTGQLPTHPAEPQGTGGFADYVDNEPGPETMVQPTIQQGALLPRKSSSLRSWVIGLGVVALLLSVGLAGVYVYRCQYFGICEPKEAKPVGIYTLVFSGSSAGVGVFLKNKPFPASQMKSESSSRIRLTFSKGGSFILELRKRGCRTIKNRVRISLDMEIETPMIRMNCSTRIPDIPRLRTVPQPLKRRHSRRRRSRRR